LGFASLQKLHGTADVDDTNRFVCLVSPGEQCLVSPHADNAAAAKRRAILVVMKFCISQKPTPMLEAP